MKQVFLIIVLMAGCLFSGCKSKQLENEVNSLNKEVEVLHDETMGKHGEIIGLIAQLKTKAKDSTNVQLTLIDSIRTELDQSNESMMDWMSSFNKPEAKDAKAVEYLTEQIALLKKMKEHQTLNIEEAKKLLR